MPVILLGVLLACAKEEPTDTAPVDLDDDGFLAGEDCDDTDPAIHPDAQELCDGVDQDCDAVVDEDATDAPTWFEDVDDDGFGSDAQAVACDAPADHVAQGGDCDDADPAVHPDATEVCDELGTDEDCDGLIDDDDDSVTQTTTWFTDADDDGYGDEDAPVRACVQPDDAVDDDSDCDDENPDVHPDALEICNGIDDDCDGVDRVCYSGLYDQNTANGYWAAESTRALLSVGRVGDLDGDGVDDLAVGDSSFRGAGDASGGVWVLYGGASVENGGTGDLADEPSLVSFTSATGLGAAVAPAGDVDEDGYDDLLVGSNTGAWLLYGGPDRWGHETTVDSVPGAVFGISGASQAGQDLASHAGDLDGDGHVDLVFGDWLGGTSLNGAVTLLYGDGTGQTGAIDASSAPTLYASSGPLGLSSRMDLGDVDGDGLDDLIAGYSWRPNTSDYRGQAWLVLGDSSRQTGDTAIASAAAAWWTGAEGERLAEGVAVLPDMDGDGYDELAISANQAGAGAERGGAVWVYAGGTAWSGETSTSAADLTIVGTTDHQYLGYRITGATDLDGDGLGDLVVTATDYPHDGDGRGAVLVFPGSTGGLTGTLDSSAHDYGWRGDGDGNVYNRVTTADVNGDGLSDIATPRSDTAGYRLGVNLYLGGGER